ncbi:MAG: hypothetical protein ACOC40_03065 [Thermoplasmatota archaeon]
MNYIEPFQKYISPMGAMGVIADSLGGSIPAVGNLFETVENIIGEGVATIVETFMGLAEGIAGDTALPEGFDMTVPSMTAIENFLDASGMLNSLNSAGSSLISGVLEGVSSFVGENAGNILGYTGALLTGFSLIYAIGFDSGASRIGSLIVGSISAALEAVTMIGFEAGWFGLGGVVAIGTFGFVAGIWTIIMYGMGIAENGGTTHYEAIIVGADVCIDFTGYFYGVSKAS